MTKEKRLKKEAMEAAKWRGHKFSGAWWQGSHTFGRNCVVCDAWVLVDTKPAPNSIDIGGTAVALNCPVRNVGGEAC